MRSFPASDTWAGVAVAAALVGAAGFAAVAVDRHAEQHGHCAPLAMIDVELAQRLQNDCGLEVGATGHVGIVHPDAPGKNVRGGRP